jgi:heat shock protein HtpX
MYRLVADLAKRANLPAVPQLALIESPDMNALTVGDRHDAAIVLTRGLLARLTERELAGVLAHEISHVRNNDIRVLTLGETVRRITSLVSRVGLFLLLVNLPLLLFSSVAIPFSIVFLLIGAPLVSLLLYLSLSRSREFAADLDAVRLTSDPAGLSAALRKIAARQRSLIEFFFPTRSGQSGTLFRTHPATDERIRRLESLIDRNGSEIGRHSIPVRWV